MRHPQRKGQIKLLTSVKTHLGTGRTVARYKSLLIPNVLTMRDLPTRDKDRDFHKLRRFSSFLSFGRQLSDVVTCPKTTPKIFILETQVRPSGWSVRERHTPNHMASVLETLSLAPDPRS